MSKRNEGILNFLAVVIARERAAIYTGDSDDPAADEKILYHLEDIILVAEQINDRDDRERMLKTVAQLFEGEPDYQEKWRP